MQCPNLRFLTSQFQVFGLTLGILVGEFGILDLMPQPQGKVLFRVDEIGIFDHLTLGKRWNFRGGSRPTRREQFVA